MRVLFLTRYAPIGASSRYRVYQYLPALAAAGHSFSVEPFFDDVYLNRLYAPTGNRYNRVAAKYSEVARAYFHRMKALSKIRKSFDVVYLEYEAVPYLPYQFEKKVMSSGARVVVDYDDAIHLNYAQRAHPLVRMTSGNKIARIVERCSHVIVANRTLHAWAQQYNANVTTIPTCIDLQRYSSPGSNLRAQSPFVIVWIGTPVTVEYLSLVSQPLQNLARRYEITLKVIGAPGYTMEGVPTVSLPWSQEREVAELQSAHAGIMPLADDEWSRGKSALKLLQYMAAGIAAVASPVGANCDVIENNINGLLAADGKEWENQLQLLIENLGVRTELAAAGRRTVERSYSLEVNAPIWLATVTGVAPGSSGGY